MASDTSFTVTRGAGGTTAAQITTAWTLTRVGNAQSEGNLSIVPNSSNPTKFTNYTQIFKTPYQITGTALETKFRTGDPKKNEQKRKAFIHSEKIEQSLFWGVANETTDATNGNMPLRYSGGLRSFITSNRTIFAVTPTIDTFMDAISAAFNYDAGGAGDERIVYGGNGALNMLNKLARTAGESRFTYDGVLSMYGQRMVKWVMPTGTLALKSHPLFNVHPEHQYSMFVVNPMGVIYRPLRNRDTKLQKNIQPPDADYVKDQWLTEMGLEVHFERTFAYIGNFKTLP